MSSSVIMSLLNKVVPFNIALQGLEKINPKFKSFIAGAAAAGYASNEILDFLRDQFSSEEETKEGARPDQKAAINRKGTEGRFNKNLGTAATVAGGLAGGLGVSALTAAAPLAAKALASNANPALAGQAATAQAPAAAPQTKPAGLASTLAANVAAQNAPQTASPPPVASPNVAVPQQASQAPLMAGKLISQFPQLGKFMDSEIAKGLTPVQAATNARKQRMLAPIVSKIESDIGESFEDLIGRLYADVKPNAKPAQGSNAQMSDAELMSSLQKIMKM